MNRHQLRGRISQATGKAKEITGRIFRNKPWEGKGRIKRTGGKVQASYGDLKHRMQTSDPSGGFPPVPPT